MVFVMKFRIAPSLMALVLAASACSGRPTEAVPGDSSTDTTTSSAPVVSAAEPVEVDGLPETSVFDSSPTDLSVDEELNPAPLHLEDPSEAVDREVSNADNEEPRFDLGPDVVLDVDLARFPPDDAGQGGAGTISEERRDGGQDAPLELMGWAAVDAYLEQQFIRPGNISASVAVSINGEVVHAAAFGVRDPARGDVAEPQDRFRVASISKLITAMTAMRLVESGMVGLDDPIGQLVADHIGMEQALGGAQRLTLRQLLNHRSGFGKYQSTFFGGGARDCAGAARQGLAQSGGGGGGYVYSNMNFCIAGLVIEAITGLSYEQSVYQSVLTPLGISGMRLAPTFDPGPDEAQHVTTPGRNYMETLAGAGAWVASPTDLVTILDSLDLSTSGFKPLTLETVLAMVVPPGGKFGQRGYGLGVVSYGAGRFGHTGTIESTHAMLLNRGDGVSWAITVAGQSPSESTDLERIMNAAFAAGGFVAG
ncbi:MAG: D-alanyl-D-alanine carboxypeptidase [Candidatus Aldehydirespiratoraceae bacterium]|jgi:D-alanyl-D-alanine carboxypeptidase